MINKISKAECTGCSACVNICPKTCIEMNADSEGFDYPIINIDKCIECTLCEKVCPIISETNNGERFNEPLLYAGWSKNDFIRYDSTSGGIFSELANEVLRKGGYVCGAIYDDEWYVTHYISNKSEDITKIRSSKYLQSSMGDIMKRIKTLLIKGEKVLICGTPCQIEGLYSFLGKEYNNLITCDFICRGVNSPKIFNMYVKYLEETYKAKITEIKFKDKTKGWHRFSTRIEFDNGKRYVKDRYTDSYMRGYLMHSGFMRPSCYDCPTKGLPRVADLSLADFWGIEKINPNLDNDTGTSMILVNSQKGKELFEDINKYIDFEQRNLNEITAGNQFFDASVIRTVTRDKIFSDVDKMTYKELSDKYFPEPSVYERFIRNTKIKVKRILGRY